MEAGAKIAQGRLRHVEKQLRIEDGILTKSGRPVVPPTLRKFVMEQMHGDSHIGSEKLYERISKKFYWPNLYRYVSAHAAHCEICQQCKPSSKSPKAPLLRMQEPEFPMQFIT